MIINEFHIPKKQHQLLSIALYIKSTHIWNPNHINKVYKYNPKSIHINDQNALHSCNIPNWSTSPIATLLVYEPTCETIKKNMISETHSIS